MKRSGLILLLACAGALAQQKPDPAQYAQEMQVKAEQQRLKALEASLTAGLSDLRQRYTEDHPEIIKLKTTLDQVHRDQANLRDQAGTPLQLPRNFQASLTITPKSPLSLGRLGPENKWWNDPNVAAMAGLTKEQQRKMDLLFLQYRLKLIGLNAALEKEEVALEPLVAADWLDEPKIAAQIDRAAQARAELEKANGRMLLGIRMVLTPEQWKKMQQ
jgi:Spy/CpxP family protein refolding chaperone